MKSSVFDKMDLSNQIEKGLIFMGKYLDSVLESVHQRYPYQKEFIQAVDEVFASCGMLFEDDSLYAKHNIAQRLSEPDRIISFRVCWMDDAGKLQVNRGYRIEYNNAIGPYKGGLRFNPNVNEGMLKFLGFEQTFKNALTTLPIGGAKGGSDFDPKGKSDGEIFRFCAAFMSELYKYIGPYQDVPAGDMGVGGREIGYLYGTYKKLTSRSEMGVLTGKPLMMGGSLVRTEATGYGLVYFTDQVLKHFNIETKGLRTIVSGAGNVAIYAAKKARELGYHVVAMSDSKGYVVDDELDIDLIQTIKEKERGSLQVYVARCGHGQYHQGSVYDDPTIDAKVVLPCAKENEIDAKKAVNLIHQNVLIVAEGANMPSNNEAIALYKANHIIYLPGKAANAGGVATSVLEMNQNATFRHDAFDIVDHQLQDIMHAIHAQCLQMIEQYHLDPKDYQTAANLAGMKKVCDSMIAQGQY